MPVVENEGRLAGLLFLLPQILTHEVRLHVGALLPPVGRTLLPEREVREQYEPDAAGAALALHSPDERGEETEGLIDDSVLLDGRGRARGCAAPGEPGRAPPDPESESEAETAVARQLVFQPSERSERSKRRPPDLYSPALVEHGVRPLPRAARGQRVTVLGKIVSRGLVNHDVRRIGEAAFEKELEALYGIVSAYAGVQYLDRCPLALEQPLELARIDGVLRHAPAPGERVTDAEDSDHPGRLLDSAVAVPEAVTVVGVARGRGLGSDGRAERRPPAPAERGVSLPVRHVVGGRERPERDLDHREADQHRGGRERQKQSKSLDRQRHFHWTSGLKRPTLRRTRRRARDRGRSERSSPRRTRGGIPFAPRPQRSPRRETRSR